MKTFAVILLIVWSSMVSSHAHPQIEHLKVAYQEQGDAFFVPLYWLPETRETVHKYIPDHGDWVGFEPELWKKIKEDDKQRLIEELGQKLAQMEGARLAATWNRIWDWQPVSSQLGLLVTFLGSQEEFLDMAYSDPLLRPAFDWVTKRRPENFDTAHIGSTLSTGETTLFFPILIEHMLNTSKKQQLECFSRLLAKIAETKTTEVTQDTDQSATTTKPQAE